MIDVNVITLEDNREYIIVDAIEHDNNKYVVLVNEDDKGIFLIRRIEVIDNKEYLTRLDSTLEFDSVAKIYFENHKGMIDNEEK